MWYLVTLELEGLVSLKTEELGTNINFVGKEDGLPVFNVSGNEKDYQTELVDGDVASTYGEILTELQSINPSNFMVINFCTMLIRWEDSIVSLTENISRYISKSDKFFIFPITRIAASNIPAVEFQAINRVIK